MNIQSYLESGVLELYALGQLQGSEKDEVESNIIKYPEIRSELQKIELLLENFAISAGIEPSPAIKQNLINTIFENPDQVKKFPVLNSDSDHIEWLSLVSDLLPSDDQSGGFNKILHQTEDILQILIVSTEDFENEIHTLEVESFLILQGTCKCTIEDTIFFMEPGNFMEIPLHKVHKVEILDSPVTAIMQRQYLS